MSGVHRALALALALALAIVPGCFKRDEAPLTAAVDDQVSLSNETLEKLDAVAAAKPSRYAFPSDLAAAKIQFAWLNGTIGAEANAAFEAAQDRGGTSFNTIVQAQDFSSFVPAGQPTLINVRLWFDNGPGRSVDLDIYVDAYGAKTHEQREYADEMTWTLPVKTQSVSTVGLAPTTIGVQAANGRIAPGQSVNYWMRIEFLYTLSVAAPQIPYALQVPANATGLIVESVKFAGDTHVQGRFVVVSPQDELVVAMEFDDIAIPTQSVYVPISGPGEYVFYTIDVHNGFFAVRADAPLDDSVARPLERRVTETPLVQGPAAPGMAEHHAFDPVTPYTEGASVAFTIDGPFPLEVWPYIEGEGATGDVELRVSSSKGLVAKYHRFLRADTAQGTLGVSDENNKENLGLYPTMLAKGAHTLSAVVNGMSGQAGVRVVTYVR